MRAAALVVALRCGVGPRSAAADGNVCPKGYFHSTEISFDCGKHDASGYIYVDSSTGRGDFVVPHGVTEGRFTFQAGRGTPSQVAFLDPTTDASLVVLDSTSASPQEAKLSCTQNGSSWSWVLPSAPPTNSQSTVLATLTRGSGTETQLAFQSELLAAVHIRLVYNSSASPPLVPGQRRQLANVPRNLTSADFTFVTYNYDKDKDCDKPSDCLPYDALTAREAVFNWSAWIASVYPDAKAAWQDLCPEFPQEVPLHWWQAVWLRWPESNMSTVPWQAAFKYINALQTEDIHLSFGEFSSAFDFAAVGLSIYSWCVQLHKYHKTVEEAWGAVHGTEDLNFARWQNDVWPSFVAPDNFKKAATEASFRFVDASSSGVVSESEFMNIWNECHNGYDPVTRHAASTLTRSTRQTTTIPTQGGHESATNDEGTVPRSWSWSFVIIVLFVVAVLFCAFSLVVRLFYAKKKSRRTTQPKYMALHCDDKSDDGDEHSDEEDPQAPKESWSLIDAFFNMVDSNKDGVITREEWEQAMHGDRNGNCSRDRTGNYSRGSSERSS